MGEEGLKSLSKRPKNSPATKVGTTEEELILALRRERNIGARRIQSELKRLHELIAFCSDNSQSFDKE